MAVVGVNQCIREMLRMINHQLKAMCEIQRASLTVYKDTHLLQLEERKSRGSGPGLNCKIGRALEKVGFQPYHVC